MKRTLLYGIALISALILTCAMSLRGFISSVEIAPIASYTQLSENYGKLPLSFESNQGQADNQVKFLSRGNGYSVFLTPTEAILNLTNSVKAKAQHKTASNPNELKAQDIKSTQSAVLRMKLLAANPSPSVIGLEELPGKSNYFVGNDSRKWRIDIPTYARVKFGSVYPGVDLVYYGTQSELEYDFIVAPGSDPKTIALAFEGTDKIEVDATGDLVVHTVCGEVRQHKPFIYQIRKGERETISGGFVLKEKNQVGFQVINYDSNIPLFIDPVLSFSTYLGGSGLDEAFSIVVDEFGNAYVTGKTVSTDFPVFNSMQSTNKGGFDVFVTKYNAAGSALIYSTYLGGSENDGGLDIAVDVSNNVYLTGFTSSNDFPAIQPYQKNHAGSGDAFVVKLNPTGSTIIYSTYLGGSGFEEGHGIAVDVTGNAYLTGTTFSDNFPTANPFDRFKSFGSDVFVTKLNTAGSALVYSTYLGGFENDEGHEIAVDASSGEAYVTGRAWAAGFPYTNLEWYGDNDEAFVAKFNPGGSALVYAIPFGGKNSDEGSGITVDKSGNVYLTGSTSSTDFPIQIPFRENHSGETDVFVTKFNASGSMLLFSTYLGGSSRDEGRSIAVDRLGNVYVIGLTTSIDFDTVNAIQRNFGGLCDAFVTKFNDKGTLPLYSTYLGGSDEDEGRGIAVDAAGNAYLTGITKSDNFPKARPLQTNRKGQEDVFVAKIANPTTSVQELTDGILSAYELGQNYPNPFNPATTISFSLPHTRYVTLKIFDILGQEVATLVDENIAAGQHKVRWDATGVESGAYFYQLRAGEFVATKKRVLMK